jgi:hypothetical protein
MLRAPGTLSAAAVVLAAAVGVGVPVAPGTTLAAVGVVVALLVFVATPKFAAVLTLVIVLLDQSLVQLSGVSELSYLDEAAVLLCMVVFLLRRIAGGQHLRRLPGTAWFGLYILAGALSSIGNHVPPLLALGGCLLLIKGPLLALAFAQLDWTPADARRAVRIGATGLVVVLVCAAMNLLMPDAWSSALALEGDTMTIRFAGLLSLVGPFVHPSAFGQICALAVAAVIAYRSVVRTGIGSAILLTATGLATLLSFRRAAVAGMITAGAAARLTVPARRTSTALVVVLAAPALLLVLWDTLVSIVQYTYEDYIAAAGTAARSVMYIDSVGIALSHAPLGVGFSRYGSFLAGVFYSPEYQARGYEAVWGLGPDRPGEQTFLTDTFWPAILGETGFLGLVGYAAGLFVLGRAGLRLFRGSRDPYVAWLGVVMVAWSVEYFVESLGSAVYTTPPSFGLLFGVAGIVTTLLDRKQEAAPDRSRAEVGTGG